MECRVRSLLKHNLFSYTILMRLSVSHAESVKNLFILSKDSILIRLCVFHFVPPYTCSVLNCLSQFETLHYPWIPSL
jgi:uncharacterized membrane protein YjfL (UPF0719 family)